MGKGYVASVRKNPVACHVHAQIANSKLSLWLFILGTAQHSPHAAEQLHHAERFDDIVVRAAIQTLYLVHFLSACRDHNHRQAARAGILLKPGQQAVSVLSGQHHIQKHQLRQLNAHGLQKGLSLLKATRLKACLPERIALQLADARIVLYDVDH